MPVSSLGVLMCGEVSEWRLGEVGVAICVAALRNG